MVAGQPASLPLFAAAGARAQGAPAAFAAHQMQEQKTRSLYSRQLQAAEPQESGSLLARWVFARPSSYRIKFRADIGKDSL